MLDFSLIFLPFLLAAILAPRVVRLCQRWGMVAEVTERSAHAEPTPLGGGILLVGLVTPLAVGLVWLLALPNPIFLTVLFISALAVAGVGLLDDRNHLPQWQRLLVHVGAVGLTLAFLPPMFDIVPVWLEKAILLLAWVWFVNLYNFMDGLDGLATSQAVFLAMVLALLASGLKPIGAVLAGACLGFLRVNWQPAKVFLGDVGSTWLGFVLGGLLFAALIEDTWRMVYPLFTVTLVFSGDATYTLFKLISERKKPWVPHREFWFHRAARIGYSHAQVVKKAMLMNLVLLIIAVLGLSLGLEPLTVPLGLLVLYGAARHIRYIETYGRT